MVSSSGGDNSSLLGKCPNFLGHVLLLVVKCAQVCSDVLRCAQMAARYVGTSVGNPGARAHRTPGSPGAPRTERLEASQRRRNAAPTWPTHLRTFSAMLSAMLATTAGVSGLCLNRELVPVRSTGQGRFAGIDAGGWRVRACSVPEARMCRGCIVQYPRSTHSSRRQAGSTGAPSDWTYFAIRTAWTSEYGYPHMLLCTYRHAQSDI